MLRLYTCLVEQHDPWLVVVASAICATGAHATFLLLRVAGSCAGRARALWTLIAAATTGTALWATHFVAMIAYAPGVPAGYDHGLTLASLALPIAVNLLAFALALAGRDAWRAVLAGLLVGAGAAGMHYTGMAAFRVAGDLLWDRGLLAASVLLGVPVMAVAIAMGLRAGRVAGRGAAAALLVVGVCTLHFLGMAAVVVLPDAEASPPAGILSTNSLAITVGLGTAGMLAASLAGAARTVRQRRRRLEAERLRTLADAAVEGLLITDGRRVASSNRSLHALLGRGAGWFEGRALADLIPHAASRALLLGQDGASLELALTGADGADIPVEIVSRPITYQGAPHHVLAVRDLRDRRRAEQQIRFLAHHDPLTGLPNRTAFGEHLARTLETHRSAGGSFAVLALDLDRFKIVNDSLGHAMGDALLVKAARRLRAALRQGDLVARLGGDEFGVVQTGGAQPEAAEGLARRIVELLSRPFLVQGQVINIGTSVGIALFPRDGEDAETLSRSADLALYRAKAEGRGAFRIFEPSMDARMQHRRALEAELRAALATRQFHLVFQPLLDTASGRIEGFEALIRWRHPSRGILAPAEFVPLAEETGLIVPIGEWVLREACREAALWRQPATVAVNLSPVQFRSPDLVNAVAGACAAAGLDPARLELEITETALLADRAGTLETLGRLKALGVRVAMDDFGTGYSSLSYLRSFPFDRIKIDRSFVADATIDEDAAAIVRAIIGLGRSLGMRTTVEGVETPEQLAHVRAEGCDQVQGYLIGRPLLAEAVRSLLGEARAA